MCGQLGFHGPLDQSLGELLQQPVFAHNVFRLLVVHQQLVENFYQFPSVLLSLSFFPGEKPFTQSYLNPLVYERLSLAA
jgi:hypothetical protein